MDCGMGKVRWFKTAPAPALGRPQIVHGPRAGSRRRELFAFSTSTSPSVNRPQHGGVIGSN